MRRPDTPDAVTRVRAMRQNPTEPEKRLWLRLRNRQVDGIKFRRQVWLAEYIADFYAAEQKLVIEVDGDGHAAREAADQQRSALLESKGFTVIRFSNAEIMGNIEGVLEAIGRIARLIPSPSHSAAPSGALPLPQGERGL
ncbi:MULTISPECIES: endonuclease domain-containing protein [unclassified Sphingobium]|uniref:endonuclease domain-containing protein n=1 Tax=unclassified Sphingobium TaxID=2611147 RepID=UPI0035A5D192